MERLLRVGRGMAIGVGVLALILGLATLGLVVWLRTDGGKGFVRRRLEAAIARRVEGTVRIGAVEGPVVPRIRLRDVVVRDADGRMVVRAARVEVAWDPWTAALGRPRIGLRVKRPEVWIAKRSDEKWNVSELVHLRESDKARVVLDDVRVEDGRLEVRPGRGAPERIDGLRVTGSGWLEIAGGRITRALAKVARMNGSLRGIPFHDGELEAKLAGSRIAIPRVAAVVPGAALEGLGTATTEGAVAIDFVIHVNSPSEIPDQPEWKKALLSVAKKLAQGGSIHGAVIRAPNGPAEVRIDLPPPFGVKRYSTGY